MWCAVVFGRKVVAVGADSFLDPCAVVVFMAVVLRLRGGDLTDLIDMVEGYVRSARQSGIDRAGHTHVEQEDFPIRFLRAAQEVPSMASGA